MPDNKRRKTVADDEIFELLDAKPTKKQGKSCLDGHAIVKAIRRNPQTAERKNMFGSNYFYPLHQAIRQGADTTVVEAIYNSYPPAIQETCGGHTALNLALRTNVPTVLFLISKWQEAVHERDDYGNTSLHLAFSFNAPYEVLCSFLNIWPDAARVKNCSDQTPLHWVLLLRIPPMDDISLVVSQYPGALKEKDFRGRTPLHYAACQKDVPLDIILLLLGNGPEAITEKDSNGMTPAYIYRSHRTGEENDSDVVCKVLSSVYHLYSGHKMDRDELRAMITFFIRIKWRRGVLWIFDRDPALMKDFNISFKLFPKLFFAMGKNCKTASLWEVLRNELDTLEGV